MIHVHCKIKDTHVHRLFKFSNLFFESYHLKESSQSHYVTDVFLGACKFQGEIVVNGILLSFTDWIKLNLGDSRALNPLSCSGRVLNQKNQKVSVNSAFSPERKSVFKSESGQTHFHINVFAVVCNNHLLKGEFNSS